MERTKNKMKGLEAVKVDEFKYLVSIIQSNRQCTRELRTRAWAGLSGCR